MTETRLVVIKILAILVLTYLFIAGIGAMGHSINPFDQGVSARIMTATKSPLIALFIAIPATSLVQSSSTTSSIVVGIIAAGAICCLAS